MNAAEAGNAIRHDCTVVARLAADASFDAAARDINAFAGRMSAAHPESHANVGARIASVEETTVRGIRPALLVAAGGVALLLLVASANAITLMIARAAGRQHETALRTALGASTGRLLSLAISESVVYTLLGGLAGLAVGSRALHLLIPLFAATLPKAAVVGVDSEVVLFTTAIAAILGVAFGLVVAAHAPARAADALKASSRTTTAGRAAQRTRSLLVISQVALAVMLLSGAGLMLNSVARLSRVSPGFDADHVLSFRLALDGTYDSAAKRIVFARDLTNRLASIPGVNAAALTSQIPFGGTRGANGVEIEGRPVVPGQTIIIDQRHVTPDYFAAMRMRLLEGRGLTPQDDQRAEPVVVVNRTMARRYWPGASAVDRRVRITAGFGANQWLRVIGVVDDVRHISLSREFVPEMSGRSRRPRCRTLPSWCGPRATRQQSRRRRARSFRRSTPACRCSTCGRCAIGLRHRSRRRAGR